VAHQTAQTRDTTPRCTPCGPLLLLLLLLLLLISSLMYHPNATPTDLALWWSVLVAGCPSGL
jgi:hypothetical protein